MVSAKSLLSGNGLQSHSGGSTTLNWGIYHSWLRFGQGSPWDGSGKDLWFAAPRCPAEKPLSADGIWDGLLCVLGTGEYPLSFVPLIWIRAKWNGDLKTIFGLYKFTKSATSSTSQETSAGVTALAKLTWCTALTARWASSPSPMICSWSTHLTNIVVTMYGFPCIFSGLSHRSKGQRKKNI